MENNFEEIKKWDKFSKFHVLNSTNFLISKLKHKKKLVVVDVGANSGTFFDLLLDGLDIEKAVLFEPHPKLYEYLRTKYDRKNNIVIENLALSDSIKPYDLNVLSFDWNIENNIDTDNYNLGLSYVDFVEESENKTNYFDNLKDRYSLDRIDLLKIDTETEDLFVLKGFTETIKGLKSKPIIELENNWWSKYTLEESQVLLNKFCEEAGYINNIDLEVRGDFYLFPIESESENEPKSESKVKIEPTNKTNNNNNVTIVTGLWDMGRGELDTWAKRDFQHYKERFFEMLETDIPMCIWIPSDLVDDVERIRKDKKTKIFIKEVKDFETWNPFFEKIQEIRKNESWLSQAGWLRESPQAALRYYNAMMFTKMFMLNDSSIVNPFNTDYFFWIDGGLTNTVDRGYFTYHNVLNNLPNYVIKNDGKFIHITYPYTSNDEIHGFERNAMARYCNTDYVNYVARGGFFGGTKESLNKINSLYYNVMETTLKEGLMGADECFFTILCHLYPELIHRYIIEGNGLVWPFFEELMKYETKLLKNDETFLNPDNVSLYVITFNSPNQFKTLIQSMKEYDIDFLNKPKKYLLNNSSDESTTPEYERLCEEYDFEHIKKDNLGICGGRQFIAEHFRDSDSDYMLFFEDDMFFYPKKNEICKSGFNRYTNSLYQNSIKIIHNNKFDFLKLNFSEFYGTNSIQWSWYNVPQDLRELYWPEKPKLPIQGTDPNAPKTNFKTIDVFNNIPFVTGEIYYSNWPQIVSREGNKKMFLNTTWARPHEQTWMSHMYQMVKKGELNPALLLLTPTEHNRFEFYEGNLRKES